MKNGTVACRTIIEAINRLISSVPNDDGLLVGDPDKPVGRILIAPEISEQTLSEAAEAQADLIVSCHGLMEGPLTTLREDSHPGRVICQAVKAERAVYCPPGSAETLITRVNEALGHMLGLQDAGVLKVTAFEKCYKLVTCIPVLPEDYTARIRQSLGDLGLADGAEGTGVVGDYSHVCDYVTGIQNFVPLERANPFIGEPGVLESVQVDRLEMIVPERMADQAVATLLEIHPYEEVEYDLYPLHETRGHVGYGRAGAFSQPRPLREVVETVKEGLRLNAVRVSGAEDKQIRTVALCSGSGGSLLEEAHQKGVEVYITDGMSDADWSKAERLGLAVIVAEARALERPFAAQLKQRLAVSISKISDAVEVIESAGRMEPYRWA